MYDSGIFYSIVDMVRDGKTTITFIGGMRHEHGYFSDTDGDRKIL